MVAFNSSILDLNASPSSVWRFLYYSTTSLIVMCVRLKYLAILDHYKMNYWSAQYVLPTAGGPVMNTLMAYNFMFSLNSLLIF